MRIEKPLHAPLLIGVFSLIFALVGWDLLADRAEGVDLLHVAIEGLVLLVSGGAAFALIVQLRRQAVRARQLAARLNEATDESRRWRDRYHETVRGLARAIQDQFERWDLTRAEAEIALLLLKGLTLKEIAAMRGTGERTVREQARAVYQKAGLAGRSELSAFFLEDLLLPD